MLGSSRSPIYLPELVSIHLRWSTPCGRVYSNYELEVAGVHPKWYWHPKPADVHWEDLPGNTLVGWRGSMYSWRLAALIWALDAVDK